MFSLFRGKGSLLVHTVSTVAKCSLRIFGIRASLLAILSSNSKSFYLLESGYELYLSSSDLPLTSVTLSPETKCTLSSDWCLDSGGDPGFRKLFSFALRFGSSFNWRVTVNNFIKLIVNRRKQLIHANYSICNYNYPIQSTFSEIVIKTTCIFRRRLNAELCKLGVCPGWRLTKNVID